MPNWCYNTAKISGSKTEIERFVKFLKETEDDSNEGWFTFFRPMPQKIKNTENGWYEWSINNWGCKWNCQVSDWTYDEDTNTVSLTFDSPWSPPIQLYEYIDQEFDEFNISAEYCEEGIGFVGEFVDGRDDCYDFSDLEDLEYIPEHLVDNWNIRESLEERNFYEDEEE